MDILKHKREKIAVRLSNALDQYSISEIAKAYGCIDSNIRTLIIRLSEPNSKVGLSTMGKLRKALDKLGVE